MILPLFLHKTGPQTGNSINYPPHHIHHWKALELTEILAPTLGGVWGWKSGARFFSTCPDWSGSLPVDCVLLEMLAHLKIIITSTSLPRAVKNKYVKTVQISFQNSIIFTFVPLKVTGIEACYKFCLILKVSIFLSVIYLLSLRKSESEQINLR